MTARIIDGKVIASELRARVAGEVARVKRENGITPGLAVVLVGNDPDRQTFSSRLAAIRFAMQRAASLARTSREARVVIEGADGQWRRFDATMTSID